MPLGPQKVDTNRHFHDHFGVTVFKVLSKVASPCIRGRRRSCRSYYDVSWLPLTPPAKSLTFWGFSGTPLDFQKGQSLRIQLNSGQGFSPTYPTSVPISSPRHTGRRHCSSGKTCDRSCREALQPKGPIGAAPGCSLIASTHGF